jgi:hypothetical protein
MASEEILGPDRRELGIGGIGEGTVRRAAQASVKSPMLALPIVPDPKPQISRKSARQKHMFIARHTGVELVSQRVTTASVLIPARPPS